MACGKIQQPRGLFCRLPRLHRDGSHDAGRTHDLFQFGDKKIAADFSHLVAHPCVVAVVVLPEMMVCVDGQRIAPFVN
jgi:hypothetical protein